MMQLGCNVHPYYNEHSYRSGLTLLYLLVTIDAIYIDLNLLSCTLEFLYI